MKEIKIGEVRPHECNTRIGDAVEIDKRLYLKVKCRRCSKTAGYDIYHYVSSAITVVTI